MNRLRTLTALAAAVLLSACAGTWQSVYAGAAAAADYVDTTHRRGWSEPLNRRVDQCEQSTARGVASLSCLGPYVHNPEVIEALERYNAAADVLTASLLATDPKGDQSAVVAAWTDVLAAARAFVALLPDGERYLRQVDALTRRVGRRAP